MPQLIVLYCQFEIIYIAFFTTIHINIDMSKRRYSLPSTTTLIAFESAARLENFSRAAEELNTSQSALSRHITELEARLGIRLFVREGRRVWLNPQGKHLYQALQTSLNDMQSALASVSHTADDDQITILCTHEISHLFIMPRFEKLQQRLNSSTKIRIMTYEYDMDDTGLDQRVDLKLTYRMENLTPGDYTTVLTESVRPVCSPSFAEKHAAKLAGPISDWNCLPILQLTKQNEGWANWESWMKVNGAEFTPQNSTGYDNYVYLLEAASAGRGLALGWKGLIDRHLETGALITMRDDNIEFENALYAVLTARGKQRKIARNLMILLGAM